MGKRVAVLMGGWGEEREVSLRSGEAACRALRARGHAAEAVPVDERLDVALRARRPDVCFLALHGRLGEDGHVQGLLETMGLPYTGSGVLASALAMDKPSAKRLFAHANLPIARGYSAHSGAEALTLHGDLGFPCVVKPSRGGSSVGLTLVESEHLLADAVDHACAFGGGALVERRITGKEVTVGILDGRVLGSLEVAHGQRTFDHAAKYQRPYRFFSPPRLGVTRRGNVEALALAAYQTLGCRGYARVDLLCPEEDNEVLLEVNTLPGLTETSLFPKIARAAGLSFEALIERLLSLAALDEARTVARPTPRAA